MLRLHDVIGALLLGSLVSVVAPDARAEVQAEFGGRVGYGLPLGKLGKDLPDIKDGVMGQIPLWLDAGARIGGHLFVGAYFSYGFGIFGRELGDECDTLQSEAGAVGVDVSCRAQDTRLGVEVLYHLTTLEEQRVDPWFGAGIGYEWLGWGYGLSAGSQHADVSAMFRGFEFLNLQLGVDFPVAHNAGIGPFAAFSLAQYATSSLSCSGTCGDAPRASDSIDDKSLHEWLLFGVRATATF